MKTRTYVTPTDSVYRVVSLSGESKPLDKIDATIALSDGIIDVENLKAAGVPDYAIDVDEEGNPSLRYNESVEVGVTETVELETKDASKLLHFLAGWQYPVHVLSDDAYYRITVAANDNAYIGRELIDRIEAAKQAAKQAASANEIMPAPDPKQWVE